MLTVHDLIRLAAERKASDIFIKAGAPPNWRLHGRIAAVDDNPMLSPEDTRRMAYSVMSHEQIMQFEHYPELDLAIEIPDVTRVRVNIHKQRNSVGMVLRLVPLKIYTLDMLGMVYRTIRQGLTDMAAMFDLIDTPAEITDKPGAPALAVSGGAVAFEDVRFGYDPDRQILNGVSFKIEPGHTLAVVGPSGAGKSTIARLLYRFYDITGGRITIDGQDLRDVTQSSLRSVIGIVPQDTVLFNDSIGYNIGYGREGSSQSEIEEAARGASIHGFIESLPEQYAAKVGERGLKLSGGEKQRVAIARTLLKNPPILILDEATSALDSRTESEIQATLERISERRTTIIIAHRLSTIVDADQIMVLDVGRVAEQGTHNELLRKGGLYAEMWARQQSEAEDEAVPSA